MSKELAIFLICYIWLGIFYCSAVFIRAHKMKKEYDGIDELIDHIFTVPSLIIFTLFWWVHIITEMCIRHEIENQLEFKFNFLDSINTELKKEMHRSLSEKELISYAYIIFAVDFTKD